MSLPLSGVNAAFGAAVKNGLDLALADDPLLGQRTHYVLEDNEYDAKKTLATCEKLRLTDQADLIFVWGSQPCLAAAPLAERHRIPMICFSGDPKPEMPYVFSFNSPTADYAKPLADYLRLRSTEPWALLQAEMPFLQRMGAEIKTQLADKGKLVTEKTFAPDAQDFRSLITNIKSKLPSSLVLLMLPNQIAPFLRQAAGMDLKVQLLGTDTFSSTDAIKESKGLMEGALYAEMIISKDFQRRYRETFGTEDNLSFAANTFEFALFVDRALNTLTHGVPSSRIIELLIGAAPQGGKVTGGYTYINEPSQGQFFRFKIGLRRIKGLDWENVN